MVTFTDFATKATWIRLIKSKDEASSELIAFTKMMATQFNVKIKLWFADGGGEYSKAKEYCKAEGINWSSTQAHAPDMNGPAEKKGKDIATKGLALLHDSGLPTSLWGEMMKTAVYIMNRTPTRSLEGNITPFQAANGIIPDISHLRVIGSLCYTHVPKQTRQGKLDSHTNLGVLVGYTDTTRMVTVYNPTKHTLKVFRDVVIDEDRRWPTRLT